MRKIGCLIIRDKLLEICFSWIFCFLQQNRKTLSTQFCFIAHLTVIIVPNISCLFYKILTRRSSSYLLDTFKSGYGARRLFVPSIRLNYGKRSLYYRGTVVWNSLPATLTEAESLHDLKLKFLAMLQLMYVVKSHYVYACLNIVVCLLVQGTAEKQLADAVSLVK